VIEWNNFLTNVVMFLQCPIRIPRPVKYTFHIYRVAFILDSFVKWHTQEIYDVYTIVLRFLHVIWNAYICGVECARWCKRTLLRFDKLLLPKSVSSNYHILKQINRFIFSIFTHLLFRDSRRRHHTADRTMIRQVTDVIISDTCQSRAWGVNISWCPVV
jgi:hypothetical protein